METKSYLRQISTEMQEILFFFVFFYRSLHAVQTHPHMCTFPQTHKAKALNISLLQMVVGISCLAPSLVLFSLAKIYCTSVFKTKAVLFQGAQKT